jgi:thiol:disulfide interchange protein DsbG
VRQGAQHPEHLIYVITDANCPYCHDLWLSLQPYYTRGIQVRYLMVAVIASDSRGKAAAILEAQDPSRALDRNERQWARLPGDLGGGIPALQSPKPETLAALRTNEQLMRELGARGTPALVYRSADHALHVVQSSADPARLESILSGATPD